MLGSKLRRSWLIAPAMAAVLTAAACSNSPSSTEASDANVDMSVLGTPQPATGTPVKVGYISEGKGPVIDTTAEIQVAQAVVKYYNEYRGGIAGHPIELVACEVKTDPARASQCANQLVQDRVVAVLAAQYTQGAIAVPPIISAGIPYFSYGGGSAPEMGKGSNVMSGSVVAVAGGPLSYAKTHNIKDVAIIQSANPTVSAALEAFVVPAFKKAGINLDIVAVPAGTPDQTPQLSTALQKKPGIVMAWGNPPFCQSTLSAAKTLNYTGVRFVIQQCLSQEAAAAIPGGFEGALMATPLIPLSAAPDGALAKAVLAKYAPGVSQGSTALNGYAAVFGFGAALKTLQDPVTPQTVATALETAKDIPMPLSQGITFSCGTHPVAKMPALCSTGSNIVTLDKAGEPTKVEVVDALEYFTS